MLGYIIRRILYSIPIAIAVSLVCFLLVHIAPGDPIASIVPADAPQAVVEQVRTAYGLDKPLPIQFAIWLGKVVQGDLGTSIATGRPVWADLSVAIRNTLTISLIAAAIGFLCGTVLGSVAAVFKGTMFDRLATALAIGGVSVPHYWLGMVLVVIFSVKLNILPAMGAGPGGSANWAWDWAHMRFLVLPSITLSVIPMGIVARSVRGIVKETLEQDFVTTLRGKGLGSYGIFLHVLKNVAPASLAIIGLQLGYLMGGSILIETVFNWPGTGFMLNNAIFQRDLPILQATVLVLGMIFVLLNLVVDLLQVCIDPRMRRG